MHYGPDTSQGRLIRLYSFRMKVVAILGKVSDNDGNQ